jgi:hypothetical protein
MRKLFLPQLATAALLTWCLGTEGGAAEVRLSGTQDRVVLETHDATIEEILTAMRSTFNLDVKLKGASARRFTGMYIGSMRQVLLRLLSGNDYVLRSNPDGISIRLLGNSTADSSAALSNLSSAVPGSRLLQLRQGQVKRQGD